MLRFFSSFLEEASLTYLISLLWSVLLSCTRAGATEMGAKPSHPCVVQSLTVAQRGEGDYEMWGGEGKRKGIRDTMWHERDHRQANGNGDREKHMRKTV